MSAIDFHEELIRSARQFIADERSDLKYGKWLLGGLASALEEAIDLLDRSVPPESSAP